MLRRATQPQVSSCAVVSNPTPLSSPEQQLSCYEDSLIVDEGQPLYWDDYVSSVLLPASSCMEASVCCLPSAGQPSAGDAVLVQQQQHQQPQQQAIQANNTAAAAAATAVAAAFHQSYADQIVPERLTPNGLSEASANSNGVIAGLTGLLSASAASSGAGVQDVQLSWQGQTTATVHTVAPAYVDYSWLQMQVSFRCCIFFFTISFGYCVSF